jgi:hypothetical protein
MRLRSTDRENTRFETIMPKRAWPSALGLPMTWKKRERVVHRQFITASNSVAFNSRRLRGKSWFAAKWLRGSDCQAMTALGATGIDHCAATAGFHPHEKTVGTLATGDGRLIGTFHDCYLSG